METAGIVADAEERQRRQAEEDARLQAELEERRAERAARRAQRAAAAAGAHLPAMCCLYSRMT